MQRFFMKKVPSYFVGGEETLCFIFKYFTIYKSSSLTFVIQTMTFQAKLRSHCFSSYTVWFWNFPNCFKPELQNHITKNIKLSDKSVTNLQQDSKPVFCNLFWKNVVSNTNLILLYNVRGSYKFSFFFKTFTINWKKNLQLIISAYIWPGLLCLLSYFKSINSHS